MYAKQKLAVYLKKSVSVENMSVKLNDPLDARQGKALATDQPGYKNKNSNGSHWSFKPEQYMLIVLYGTT